MRASLAFSLAASACLLVGCPGKSCPTTPHTDAWLALRAQDSMRTRVRSLRAEARVDQRGGSGRVRGTVLMFVERPDHVRFDAMTQLGPAATLTSDGAQFRLLDQRESRFLTGRTCASNIARLVGISLPAEELGRILLGGTPRIAGTEAPARIACEGDGAYHVQLSAPDGSRQDVVLDLRDADRSAPPEEQRLRLRSSEVRGPDGALKWRATWGDYRVIPMDQNPATGQYQGGVAMPYEVRFQDFVRNLDVKVEFQTLDINVDVPEGAFTQEAPPGMAVEESPCEENEP